MNLKVLPLDSWMESPLLLSDCLEGGWYAPVAPRYNRAGIYLAGLECWFELGDGRAYTYPTADFRYTLALHEALRLNARQAAALAAVVQQRLATREQQELLWRYRDALQIRHTGRMARKYARSRLRRLHNEQPKGSV